MGEGLKRARASARATQLPTKIDYEAIDRESRMQEQLALERMSESEDRRKKSLAEIDEYFEKFADRMNTTPYVNGLLSRARDALQ